VRGRRRDLKAINVDHLVNEDSNYCFGEAEQERILTENYTHSKKRRCNSILELLVAYGLLGYFSGSTSTHWNQ
jgi:hypothetical protein